MPVLDSATKTRGSRIIELVVKIFRRQVTPL